MQVLRYGMLDVQGSGMKWLTVPEAAAHARVSKDTVYRAAASGEMHSHQRRQGGKRTFIEAAVDAWAQGLSEKQQIEACGCGRFLRAVS